MTASRRSSWIARLPLPPGAATLGSALLVNGVCSYAYLVIAARALGPDRYAPLSVVWALVFVAAPGLFLPLEQEVGRVLAERRVRGVGARPVLVRVALIGAGLVVVLLAATALAGRPVIDRLFDGDGILLVGFAVAIASYSGYYLIRGALAGSGRFGDYGVILMVEGVGRVALCALLAVAGVRSAGVFSLAIGLPCLVGALTVLPRRRLAEPGPPAPWSELSSALGLLLLGSLLAQLLLNIGPLIVKVVGGDDPAAAGRFLSGLIVARVPLFLFQAIQASLLPRLSAQAAAGRIDEFRRLLSRLLVCLAALVAVSVAGMLLLGPLVVRLLFGAGFTLGRGDLALLAFGSELMMVSLTLAQASIALGGYGRAAAGWAAGTIAVVVTIVVVPGAVLRAELAFCAGVLVATICLGAGLLLRLATTVDRAAAA